MSYGGGYRLSAWDLDTPGVSAGRLVIYEAPVPEAEPDWREDVRQLMEEMEQRVTANDRVAQNLLDRVVPELRQFHADREEAVMTLEEQRNALELTYARFQLLAEQGVHEVVVEPEAEPETEASEEAAAPSQTAAVGSDRTRDLELIATHASVVGLGLSPDMVELAYEENNGEVVNTLMDLTEPVVRRRLELELGRELAERRVRPSTSNDNDNDDVEEEEEEGRIGEATRFFASREDEDIARAQEALTYAEEALGRSEARAWRSPDMWHRHQDAQRALRRFQGAMEEAVALRRREEENQESFVRRTQRAADIIASATQPTATQPTPVQYVQFLPNTENSVCAGALARASLTKEREDLEEQMERMEITEGVYLERMNALRDRYNRAPDDSVLSQSQWTRSGRRVPDSATELPEWHPHFLATNYGPLGIDPREERSWAHMAHPAPFDDEPPNSEIPEVD